MNSTLYYRVLTEADYCPDCRGILSHGLWSEKDQTARSVCFNCGYGYETLGWSFKKEEIDKEGQGTKDV